MKNPTRGPLFACLYPGLCDVARGHGYALAIHGSLVNDMDLVAVPWTEQAVEAHHLKDAIMEYLGAMSYANLLRVDLTEEQTVEVLRRNPVNEPKLKPHGRISWNLHLIAGAKVDLSVMPLRYP